MTNTYTQDEAVRDILRITLDSSIRPLSQTHGDQVREILDQLIATTRRETVEEIIEKVKHELKGSELFPLPERTDDISDEELKLSKIQTLSEILDQLPDKQEV